MGLKQWTNAVIGVIDKKLERFDPKWQAANGKGGLRSRYEDKTGIARHREWRGVKDTFVDYTAWLNNLLAMGKMVASAPVPILKGFWEYRWMGSYLGTFAFIDRLFEGYREDELKIAHMNMHCIVSSLTKKDRPGPGQRQASGRRKGQRQHRSHGRGHAASVYDRLPRPDPHPHPNTAGVHHL